jgi:hypothetical protein
VESVVRERANVPPEEIARELVEQDDPHNDPDDQEAASEEGAVEAASTWRVAKALLVLRDQVNLKAPGRNKSSDGTIGDARHCSGRGTSDHCARVRDGAVGVVTAIDITHDQTNGCDAGAIAESIRARKDPRVKYIIWNRRIANSSPVGGAAAWAWRTYSGSNPHDKHVHISVHATKTGQAGYDTADIWEI